MIAILTKPGVMILFAALGYAGATVAMRAAAGHFSPALIGAIGICLGFAVVAEIILLQQMHLGIAYIAILGIETLIVVGIASAIGEGFGSRELIGAALVLAGTLVLGA